MSYGLFMHRADSKYDDVPSEHYQFPQSYLTRAQKCKGDWIIYLEPRNVSNSRGYFAVAKVQEICPDPRDESMHLAIIEPGTYLDFGDPVPFRDNNNVVLERGLLNDEGNISGRAQQAVRPLSPEDFARIIDWGLRDKDPILPRDEDQILPLFDEPESSGELDDSVTVTERDRIKQLTTRVVRNRNFRKTVLRAYKERCAISGLKIINGGGRAEVEAAHIRPVQHGGPDIVSNGIALSGTAHWMFDRGLVGLDDDMTIMISRQANDPDEIKSMINDSGKLLRPNRPEEYPRAEFVTWHRDNCFKK